MVLKRSVNEALAEERARGSSLMNNSPALSVIVSTLGRHQELAGLLRSLRGQSSQDFELILVDQNPQPGLAALVEDEPLSPFPTRYLHTPDEKGLSRGRNRGLAVASGEFVVFPDDDCWYPANFIELGIRKLRDGPWDALTGRPTGEDGKPIHGRFEARAQQITRSNVWTTQIEWIAFWRRDLLVRLGGFDELIGLGAASPWQSAEGQDLMLRALAAGARCWYDPDLNAHDKGFDRRQADAAFVAKARAYGRGLGHVMRKHRVGYRTSLYYLSRSVGGSIIAAISRELPLARFHAATAVGRLEGILGKCFDGH
jgi:glycosyltransferase involved in cell wall biosynthesis